MPIPSTINKQTIIRIQVRLLGDVDEEGAEQDEGVPMETETEAVVQASTSTPRRSGKKTRASSSSAEPQDAFQVILDKLDGLRKVQTEQSERMIAM